MTLETDEPADGYDALPGLNWSTLKLVHASPMLCKLRTTEPREDSEALELGRAIHCALFEPDRWRSDYTREPDFGPRLTKDGKPTKNPKATSEYKSAFAAWRAGLPASCQVISDDVFFTAERCAAAVLKHRIAGPLLRGGQREKVIEWVDAGTGTVCKGRLDLLTPRYVADLKSTRHQSVRAFLRDAEQLLYHGQKAWYHDGAIAAGALPADADRPYVVSVQTGGAFDVACYQLDPFTLDAGRRLYRGLLARYRECQAADMWPGIAPDLIQWRVSGFAAGTESELESDW